LEKLLAADPVAHAQWDGVNKIHSKFLAKITYCRREYARKGFSKELADEIMPQRFECFTYAVAIRKKLSKIIDDAEQKQFLSPEKQQRLRQIQALLLLIGLGANVAVSWFLARFFSSDITARLAVQADNASRLARDVSLNPVVPGQDEIAQLDSAFHQTAEKLAEARRKERAVFDNSRELICVLDQTGKFLTINPVAEEIFACSRGELLEVSLFDYLEEEGKKKAAELLEENISAGKKLELTLQRDDGKLVHMLFSFTREANGGRRMADGDERIYCIGHDISDRKELEQLKQDFLSVVSHDLRTPLTSVNLAANLIEEGATGAVGKNALPLVHDISVQGEQLIELINDLLDLEKLEAKKMELVRAEKEACRLIEPALGVVEERFPDIVFIAKSQKSDARIFGDSERIAQAFTYILSYLAANSAPESDIYVQANEIDGSFRWRITQEGMPLNEAQKAQLFDRFSAADAKGRQSAGQLSILAMPLARSIIEAHGGRIMVETIPDGNSFQIELPLALKEASTS
jgi:PAS domain S-box-containing protein